MTFFALLKLADLDASPSALLPKAKPADTAGEDTGTKLPPAKEPPHLGGAINLRYNIEIHLPPTKDIEVYNAIFKSIKEHLLD